MAKSSVALTVLLVGLLLSAQSMTVYGRRGLWDAVVDVNATMNATRLNSTTVDSVEKKKPVTVEDTTPDAARFSTAKAQMEQNGWSCSGGFTSQSHAWYCAGRSAL